jgi:tetratricopeptide (TPR) repeat protein
VHSFCKTLGGLAAVAALGAVVMTGTAQHALARGAQAQAAPAQTGQTAGQAQKKPKDQGEFDIYNEVIKDVQTQNWNKATTDLDTWKLKYPESDFKDDRLYFYMQAYSGAKQPAKVLDTGKELMARDLKTVFGDPKNGPQQIVAVYYLTAVSLPQVAAPTPDQLATGEKAAKGLQDYLPTFFSADRKPPAASEADWNKARGDLETVARSTIAFVALRPGQEAAQRGDWQAAADAYRKALDQYPNNAQISYQLGSALVRTRKPEVVNEAIWEMARAAAMDPAQGGIAVAKDRADIEAYLKKFYTSVHGSAEGLDQVKQAALKSPLPPPDFAVKTQAQIAAEKEQEFEKSNPQLALWMKIKGQLVDTNGEQYFASSLKDADVTGQGGGKAFKGVVVEGKPACRSKELLVAIPEPNQQTPKPEITLKFEEPLTGKPTAGSEIQFSGVPSAFTRDPFMLTIDTDKTKIEGLQEERCAAAPAKKGVSKKSAGKKK